MLISKNSPPPTIFNYDTHVKELNERFGRLVKHLGLNNRKGCMRYDFEVDFSFALNEVSKCPLYLQGKMFDKASSIVSSLINQLKQRESLPNPPSTNTLEYTILE